MDSDLEVVITEEDEACCTAVICVSQAEEVQAIVRKFLVVSSFPVIGLGLKLRKKSVTHSGWKLVQSISADGESILDLSIASFIVSDRDGWWRP